MKPNYNFANKWSAEIGRRGYTPVPNLLISHQHDLNISNAEMAVLLGLMFYMWTSSDPYPAVSTLAKQSGMASKTIRRYIRSLEAKQLVTRRFRKAATTEYSLAPLKAKLQSYAQAQSPPTQKRAPLSSKISRAPYLDLSTKKDAANKTHLRRRFGKSETTHIKDVLERQFGGIK